MTRQVDKLTNAARQKCNLIGDNGEVVTLELYFLSTQNGWAYNLSYNDFVLNGALLTVSPNCLRSWQNLLPFGLMCNSIDGYEPQFINDFVDGRITLYLLNRVEVLQIEAELF